MSPILLDTHVFFWWCAEDPSLTAEVRDHIADPDSVVLVSAVTAWELVLKQRVGKISLPSETRDNPGRGILEAVEQSGFQPLPITFEHAEHTLELPFHHRDPFDHMLIAQARVEGLTLVTHDKTLGLYDVPVLWT